MVIDKLTQHVYVAGDNKLFKLTGDLRRIDDVTTGPTLDDPRCPPLDVENGRCPVEKLIDNKAEVLEIHPTDNYLLYCGTLKVENNSLGIYYNLWT